MSNEEFNQKNDENINWAQLMCQRATNPEFWQQAGQFVNTSYHNMLDPVFRQQMLKPIKQSIPATLNAADNYFTQEYGDEYLQLRNMQLREGYPYCTPVNLASSFYNIKKQNYKRLEVPTTGSSFLDNFVANQMGVVGNAYKLLKKAESYGENATIGALSIYDNCFK